MTLASDIRHKLTEAGACFSGLLTFAACVSALLVLSSPCVASDDAASNLPNPTTVHETEPSTTPAVVAPDKVPEKEKKNLSKYDLDKIGQRKVGSGINLYSLNREREMGQALAQRLDRNIKFLHDPDINEYIDRLGQKLVRNSDAQVPFTIKVIDSDEISAFSLPGGFLYVCSGLIGSSESEAELAGVMAHEIAHVAARHGTRGQTRETMWNGLSMLFYIGGPMGFTARQFAGLGIPFWFKKWGRDAEREADLLGIQYEYAAGYDPEAVIEFLEKQRVRETKIRSSIYKSQTHNKFINAMTTHPMTEDRIRRAQDEIALLPARNEYVLDTGDFEQVKAKLSHITNECGSAADGSPVLHRSGGKHGKCGKDDSKPTLRKVINKM
jgi:predicted Zn-dependent protease